MKSSRGASPRRIFSPSSKSSPLHDRSPSRHSSTFGASPVRWESIPTSPEKKSNFTQKPNERQVFIAGVGDEEDEFEKVRDDLQSVIKSHIDRIQDLTNELEDSEVGAQ
jgi:hypothetical protein